MPFQEGSVLPEKISAWAMVPLFLGVIVAGGGQEEIAWRGFALFHLQRHRSPLAVATVIGALHALWHWPLFLSPVATQTQVSPVGYLLLAVSVSMFYTWLFNVSKQSIVTVTLFHGVWNFPSMLLKIDGEGLNAMPLIWASVAISLIVVAMTRGRLGQQDAGGVTSSDS